MPSGATGAGDLLEQARALARSGDQRAAAAAYERIKRKDRSAATLVEHAELLLEFGDFFGAATRASDALAFEPDNARALAVQREILRREAAEGSKA